MINKLQLITFILLISSIIGQEILIDNVHLSKDNSMQSKKYTKPEWNGNLDFAIYGWIDLSEEFWNLATVYRMTQNRLTKGDNNMFDRVLTLQVIQTITGGKDLGFTTYDTLTNNPYNEMTISLSKQETQQPVFIYQGYSSKLQKLFAYVYTNEKNSYQVEIPNMNHSTSQFYEVLLNPSQQFIGQVSCLKLASGENAYRETNFKDIMNKQCESQIPPIPNPPQGYKTLTIVNGKQTLSSTKYIDYFQGETFSSNEISAYGWIKLSPQTKSEQTNIFKLSTTEKDTKTEQMINQDYFYFRIEKNKLVYSSTFTHDKKDHLLSVDSFLKEQWLFYYIAINQKDKKGFLFIQTPLGEIHQSIELTENLIPPTKKIAILVSDSHEGVLDFYNCKISYGVGAFEENINNLSQFKGQTPQ